MFSILLTPFGRYLALAALILIIVGGAYIKIRSDAVAAVEAQATVDALRRTTDAIRAGDSVPVSADRVRDHDRNERPE